MNFDDIVGYFILRMQETNLLKIKNSNCHAWFILKQNKQFTPMTPGK